MARDRLPKRPPTPSESDEEDETEDSEMEDETEDSGSEDETSESESEEEEVLESESEDLTLPVGAEAEVRSDDPGFVGSFYDVTVTGHLTSNGRGYYTVVYSTLVAEDGAPLEETAAAKDVRPRPPSEGKRREFALLEAVEAFHNEGWWAGVVSAVSPPVAGAPRVYKVAFPTTRETLEFEVTALRPHRVFQAGRWVPAAEVDGSTLFREGTHIEVSQFAKNHGESWSPACVLKVIGATNFLVHYTNIGEDREQATEIIDSQYIRPARTNTGASQSSHVEVMHEGSWWPGVIREVLGSGMDKKYVKLKSYESEMDDVECVDVLIVRYPQLRPHFDWDGKKWVRHMTEEFVNGTKLPSRKRPSSSALSLYKEVGESSDENGSYREKKLKSADVVSEPTSLLLSICIDNSEIMHKSSSCSKETMTQGNAVVALGSQLEPHSLPSLAGFAYLSYSSVALSSHLEQASSQKIITPSAPVSQSQEIQASLSGTFGQPTPPLQGPLLGMQSPNPQTPMNGAAAKGLEEARNVVSISADLAKSKNGVNDVELRCNVTAGREMISEINRVSCIDPMTTPKDVRGSQPTVSQQGGNSAMDDWLSESLEIQNPPFVKTSPMWPQIDTMEIFSKGPQQRPHLNQFRQRGPEFHEGITLGLMISFANLAESINRLDVEDDLEGLFEGKMQGLSLLEAYRFDVGALRSRLETLLYRKNSLGAELHDGSMNTLEQIARKEADDDVRVRVLGMALHHIGLYACLMRQMMRSAVTQKINIAMDISRLKSEANKLERSAQSTAVSR